MVRQRFLISSSVGSTPAVLNLICRYPILMGVSVGFSGCILSTNHASLLPFSREAAFLFSFGFGGEIGKHNGLRSRMLWVQVPPGVCFLDLQNCRPWC